jgi:hypothetical protein
MSEAEIENTRYRVYGSEVDTPIVLKQGDLKTFVALQKGD